MCGAFCGGCCGSSCGCSSEVYWSEWHNDPPCCRDPCDRCGNWIGPSGCGCGEYGGYTAPYDHPYGVTEGEYYDAARAPRPHGGTTFANKPRPGTTTNGTTVARGTANPYTKARTSRKPQQGAQQQLHR